MWIFELFERLLFYVAQIGTRSGFPDPLSPKEEQELLLCMQSGDGEARCSLIEHNLRLVAHIAKKYASGPDADDLISIGTIGLIKAVNTYDPSKSVRLAAYASRCIENAILSQRKKRPCRWRNGRLLRQNGVCWRKWKSAAIF